MQNGRSPKKLSVVFFRQNLRQTTLLYHPKGNAVFGTGEDYQYLMLMEGLSFELKQRRLRQTL